MSHDVNAPYDVHVAYGPVFELLSSLHTFICRKAYKKTDLSAGWAEQVRRTLSPGLSKLLESMEINADWKVIYGLVCMLSDQGNVKEVVDRLENRTVQELNEQASAYGVSLPDDMEKLRKLALQLLSGWDEEYFRHVDTSILSGLEQEAERRNKEKGLHSSMEWVDRTTNGFRFEPSEGLTRVLLVPQYHFQPINIIYRFGSLLLCHYSAGIYVQEDDFLSPQEYRMIRSLGEKSRLKILKYLYQSQSPRTFIEIVRHLKLSKGITHDHIFKLRASGFIHAHFDGETLLGYSARLSAVDEMHRSILGYMERN
ncbi:MULTISPECIES: ArsR family transcriptional regulator [Paenibacillus]|uniref:Transcriptional regulator n=2 Tax=Paenibacillus TaxID=44249 RepID=A0ABX2ZHA8_PAEPO|nr:MULTISPECIES: ArsR family transcriptional regulator [Paenibacillus]MDR6779221.1 DNA-binding transcriptional ArsR family regulator [Paenibacillus peoriae]ODA08031.1 transcriptional regulator [Paenibacillus polymyxa]OME67137.1 transcriptional regulator [Paenibacillus peoriae]